MEKQFKFLGRELSLIVNSDADQSVFNEIFVNRDYKILESIIGQAKGWILDLGAHKGYFSVYANAINSSVKIMAYEPDEENFRVLKENLKLNHVKNVVPKNLAIAGKEGSRVLYLSEDSHNHSLFEIEEGMKQKKTEVISLQKVLEKDFLPCDLVKMDIEGAEFEILKNMPAEAFMKIKNLYVEYHEYLPEMKVNDLKMLLERNKFKIKITPSHYDKRMGFIFATH